MIIFIIIFTYVVSPLIHVYSGYAMRFNIVILLIYAYISLLKLFYTVQFGLACLSVLARFKLLNNHLRWMKFPVI